MGTAGIQKALAKDIKQTKLFGSETLIELDLENHDFTAYIDKSCLGVNTVNPETTINGVKWLLIRQHVWLNYKELYPNLSSSEFFNTLITGLESSDYTILQGNNQKISKNIILGDYPTGNLGVIHLLMPYTNYPEDKVGNLYIVVLDKPQVIYALFKFSKEGYVPLIDNEKKAAYGQTVEIDIYTHLLPDPRNNVEIFDYTVELVNRGKVVKTSDKKTIRNTNQYNYTKKQTIKILIDPEWQKNHQNQNENEEFYIRLNGFINYSAPVLMATGTPATKGEYDSEKDTSSWGHMKEGKWIYDKSQVLYVPFDTFSDMMAGFEIEKKNTIQYIGDIRYTRQEFDPCGFSKITLWEKGDKKRLPFTIFDETQPINQIDKTDQFFSIIAGNERKDVKIVLDGLQTKNHFCQGLLLEEGQKHTERKNVFQVDKIYSALRNKDGYLTNEDLTHQEQQRNAGIYPTKENEKDRDVIKTDKVYNPSEAQHWKEGIDYEIESDNEITLKLKYFYNKTVFEGTWIQNDILDILWVFRYFWPNDSQAQIYFLPISTCRYPNQIAKIKVYPDIEWEMALSYNYNNPLGYNHGNLSSYAVEGALKKYEGLAKQDYNLSTEQSTLSKFKLGLFSPKIDGDKLVKIEFEFAEKIRKVCSLFYKMKKIADKVAYGTEGGADLLRRKKFPFEFEIKAPSTGIKVLWGNKKSVLEESHNMVGLAGSLDWYASPLIGAELKLKIHELVKYIPHPIAKIVDGIITGINSLKNENVETKFEVNLIFTGNLNANINAFQISVVDSFKESNTKSYVEGVFTVKLEVILLGKGKVSIPWTNYKFNFGAKAEAYLKAYWDAKLFLVNQEKGLYGQFSGGFSGLQGKIIVEVIVGPMTFTVYDVEDTWFEPEDVNPESDTSKDNGQKSIRLPLIENN